jgi:hypothetical protein
MPDENCKILTSWDVSLLNRHLRFYRALHGGEFKPQNVRQERFVRVCVYGEAPRTQHEIAYSRLLSGWQFPPNPVAAGVGIVDQSGTSAKVERAVDWVETSSIETEQADRADVLARLAGLYRSGVTRLNRASTDVSAWLSVVLASDPIARPITQTLTEHFGDLSNAYTRALDGVWAKVGPPPEGWNSFNHRILDGHAWSESLARARDALPDDTLLEELGGWITALASDFVTRTGLPITSTSLSESQFEAIRHFFVEKLGTPSLWPSDILTLNAVELGAGLIPIIAVVFRWSRATAAEFARLAAAVGIGSVIAASPVGLVVSLAILATAFDRVRVKGESASTLMTGAASGTVLGGGSMAAAVSVASVAGPIGAIIAAMSAAYALKRVGRSLSELDVQERAAFYITQFKRPLYGTASAAA